MNDKLIGFSDDELVNELIDRYDDIIIGARKTIDIRKGNEDVKVSRRRWWKGDYDACIGLMFGASLDCLHKNWGVKECDISSDKNDEIDEED